MIDKEILKAVKRIELSTKSTINSVMAGAYHSTFKGNGMEFAEVREYMPGDDVRAIDWNVTARTGVPHIKKFSEERELTVMLVVDASGSVDFGSKSKMKGEIMATISALLAFSATKNNDKVGVLIYTSKVELFIPPAKGRKHVLRVIRELLYFEPEERKTDLSMAFEHILKIMNQRSIVMVISDFLDDSFERSMKLLRQKHDLLAISVRDERELELPSAGFIELQDAETGETVLVDTGSKSFREEYAKQTRVKIRKTKRLFQKLSVDFINVMVKDNYDETIEPLISFFRKRAKENA